MQRRDATPVKVNCSKTISLFDKVVNDKPSHLSTTMAFRNNLKLFWSSVNVNPTLPNSYLNQFTWSPCKRY